MPLSSIYFSICEFQQNGVQGLTKSKNAIVFLSRNKFVTTKHRDALGSDGVYYKSRPVSSAQKLDSFLGQGKVGHLS